MVDYSGARQIADTDYVKVGASGIGISNDDRDSLEILEIIVTDGGQPNSETAGFLLYGGEKERCGRPDITADVYVRSVNGGSVRMGWML